MAENERETKRTKTNTPYTVNPVSNGHSNDTTLNSDYDSLLLTSPTERMCIKYENIVYKIHVKGKKKIILNDISGSIVPGELTAIIGPSGAGKSTLLDVIAGFKTKLSSGVVKVNGQIQVESNFRKNCAYIMQDDVILPNLTVMESMMVSAKLRLQTVSEKQISKNQRVIEILKTLGLEDVANSNVSDVSGGQRKRISIALELVSNPPIIILDEPTSGLDSHSAFQCINLMKALVKQGRTIACTIHQPSARLFELFDKVIVLANGSVLYSGYSHDMISYFNRLNIVCPKYHNQADFVMEVASGYYGVNVDYLSSQWKRNSIEYEYTSSSTIICDESNRSERDSLISNEGGNNSYLIQDINEEFESFKITFKHEILQFFILTKRSIRASLRDKMFTYLRLITTILIALLMGSIYYKIGNDGANVINNLGCIFFTLIYLIFICLMPTVLTFPLEKNVFIREHLNNWYTLKAYYLAKTFSDLPFQILLPIIYCIIMYYMSGQPPDAYRISRFMLVVIMSVMVSQSIGLLLGALAPNTSVAVFVAPVTGIPLLLFCGYFVKFNIIPLYLRWLTYVSYARYCWEGAVLSIYGNDRGEFECKKVPCMFPDGEEVLRFLDITEDALGIKNFRLWFCILILSIFFIILRMLTYLVLKIAISQRRK